MKRACWLLSAKQYLKLTEIVVSLHLNAQITSGTNFVLTSWIRPILHSELEREVDYVNSQKPN